MQAARLFFRTSALLTIENLLISYGDDVDLRGSLKPDDVRAEVMFTERRETQRLLKTLREAPWSFLEVIEHLGHVLKFKPRPGR